MPSPAAALTCLVQHNASLRRYNTFGVEARARWLVRVRAPAALPEVLARPEWAGAPLLVLGEGSNVLFRDDYDGLVLKLDCQRVETLEGHAGLHRIRVESGRNWHGLVRWTLDHEIGGLQNLSLIPGSVGAAPVQNIGAYGVELDPLVEAVEAYDLERGAFVDLPRAACGFGYRTSRFREQGARPQHLICAVRFALPADTPLVLHYPGVREQLASMGCDTPGPKELGEAICAIRRSKLPDPAVLGNAGSFFKNPVVPAAQAEAMKREHPGLPVYPAAPGSSKLAAAWLIEQCGLKGHRDGEAGIAESHALVLVNHGQATGAQLWSLAERVRDTVRKRFGIELEPEPTII